MEKEGFWPMADVEVVGRDIVVAARIVCRVGCDVLLAFEIGHEADRAVDEDPQRRDFEPRCTPGVVVAAPL